jgi:hypothetical protein
MPEPLAGGAAITLKAITSRDKSKPPGLRFDSADYAVDFARHTVQDSNNWLARNDVDSRNATPNENLKSCLTRVRGPVITYTISFLSLFQVGMTLSRIRPPGWGRVHVVDEHSPNRDSEGDEQRVLPG